MSPIRLCPALPAFALSALLCATACPAQDKAPTPPTTAPATVAKKITLDEFDKMRGGKDTILLDVRTPTEFAAGHVPGAVNMPVTGAGSEGFADQAAKLDKDKTYLVYCAKGGRSPVAVGKLEKMGFKHLNDFSGGMDQWKKEGKPVDTEAVKK